MLRYQFADARGQAERRRMLAGSVCGRQSRRANPISEVFGCLGKKIDTDAVMAQSFAAGSDHRH